MMVGRWVSFWDCLFLGAILNFRGCRPWKISWLEDYVPFGIACFQGRAVKLQDGHASGCWVVDLFPLLDVGTSRYRSMQFWWRKSQASWYVVVASFGEDFCPLTVCRGMMEYPCLHDSAGCWNLTWFHWVWGDFFLVFVLPKFRGDLGDRKQLNDVYGLTSLSSQPCTQRLTLTASSSSSSYHHHLHHIIIISSSYHSSSYHHHLLVVVRVAAVASTTPLPFVWTVFFHPTWLGAGTHGRGTQVATRTLTAGRAHRVLTGLWAGRDVASGWGIIPGPNLSA